MPSQRSQSTRRVLATLLASLSLGLIAAPMPVDASPETSGILTSQVPVLPPPAEAIAPLIPARIVTLGEAVKIAAAQSPTLVAPRAALHLSQRQLHLSSYALFPSVTGSASTSRQHGVESSAASIYVDQLIYDGGRVVNAIRAARHTESAAAATYHRALQTLAYNVAVAYVAVLQAERTTQADREILRENRVQLALIEAQVRAGTSARVDALTAEVPVAQAQVALAQSQGAQLSALAAFANTLGLDAGVIVQPIDNAAAAQSTATPTYPVALARANALRPDLTAARESLATAQAQLREARLGLSPTVTASLSPSVAWVNPAGVGASSPTSSPTAPTTWSTSIGASLTLPIFDQGLTANAVAEAQANRDIAEANLRTTQLGVQLNVRQALANLDAAHVALDSAQVEVKEAYAVLGATQAQWRAGVTTLPQLLNAQVQTSQALVTEVNAATTLQLDLSTLQYALGEDTPS